MANLLATKKCVNCGTTYPYHRYLENLWHVQDKNCLDYKFFGTDKKIGFALAWLHHYEYEFNESPHPLVNKIMKHLQKTSKSYDWQ